RLLGAALERVDQAVEAGPQVGDQVERVGLGVADVLGVGAGLVGPQLDLSSHGVLLVVAARFGPAVADEDDGTEIGRIWESGLVPGRAEGEARQSPPRSTADLRSDDPTVRPRFAVRPEEPGVQSGSAIRRVTISAAIAAAP